MVCFLNMKVLFVARRFPPSIGGMQKFAYDLTQALPKENVELVKVTWGGSNIWLPLVLPWLFVRGLWALLSDRSIDVIHMQDAVLSPLGWLLSKLSRRPWIVVAHGLDLTFKLAFYQKVNLFFARRCGAMVAISQATADEATRRGVPDKKVTVIPLGVSQDKLPNTNRPNLLASAGIPRDAKILITVGRLAKRKGVAWFVANVLPHISGDVHYVVIGEGVERENIERAVEKHDQAPRVHLLGEVDDSTKQSWLSAADIFVMPNITVPGDMEGFGIVAHEAAMAELPVVASNIEGIAQALQDGENSILLQEKDAKAYQKTIEELLSDDKKRQTFGRQARKYTLTTFGWSKIAQQYENTYKKLIS
jgi:phosphatidylinositol alpha-1,6-mannosyltransferase